jgi:hypothetical protein
MSMTNTSKHLTLLIIVAGRQVVKSIISRDRQIIWKLEYRSKLRKKTYNFDEVAEVINKLFKTDTSDNDQLTDQNEKRPNVIETEDSAGRR